MKNNFDEAQNKLANRIAEKIQELSEDELNNEIKIYY